MYVQHYTGKAVVDMLRVLDLCGDNSNICQQAQQQLDKLRDR